MFNKMLVFFVPMDRKRPLPETIREFNTVIRDLINLLERKSRDEVEIAGIDRLKKRISILKSTVGDYALISEAHPFFVKYAREILDRNAYETLVMTTDVRVEYLKLKPKIDPKDEFAFALVDSVRAHYRNAALQEKDNVWESVKKLLACSIEYKLSLK